MNILEDFFHTISNPNIAYILMMLGMYGLIYELASPGAILPGVVGVIALLLAFYSLGTLPINYVGLGLILFAILLFVAEVFVTSHGVLGVGGVVSLALGSMMLINTPAPALSIAWPVVAGVVLTTAAFFYIVVKAVVRAAHRPPTTGREELLQATGVARTALRPEGYVFIHGELWRAVAEDGDITEGTPVRVVGEQDLKIFVRKQDT
jgi:membrane-bound serine protease (ClpP class)